MQLLYFIPPLGYARAIYCRKHFASQCARIWEYCFSGRWQPFGIMHGGASRSGQGQVIATAKPYHLGRSTQVWSIEIHNDNRKLISVNRLTMAILSR